MSKILPKISKPGSAVMPNKGPHNPNVGTRGSGLAPKPKTSQPLLSQTKGSGTQQAGIARVASTGTSPTGKSGAAGSFMPEINNAMANLTGPKIGQSLPKLGPVATKKPNRKGGAAFFGEF